MRYRALDSNGDYTFGQGSANFIIDAPATVAQAILTRLKLLTGEWFLDMTEGTPYSSRVLGNGTQATWDQAIRQRILGTQGVTGIVSYSSALNTKTRALSVTAEVSTTYGPVTVTTSL